MQAKYFMAQLQNAAGIFMKTCMLHAVDLSFLCIKVWDFLLQTWDRFHKNIFCTDMHVACSVHTSDKFAACSMYKCICTTESISICPKAILLLSWCSSYHLTWCTLPFPLCNGCPASRPSSSTLSTHFLAHWPRPLDPTFERAPATTAQPEQAAEVMVVTGLQSALYKPQMEHNATWVRGMWI